MASALGACGGPTSTVELQALALPGSGPVAALARPSPSAEAGTAAELSAQPPTAPGDPGAYRLVLLRDGVAHQDDDELPPLHGAGYPRLRVFLYQATGPDRGRPLQVRPLCASPSRCEYLPPRKAGLPDRIAIELADPSMAILSALDESVVISARQLAFAQGAVLTLSVDMAGRPPLARRVIYAAPPPS